ncbi:MAG: glycosyltransferase family 4 protein [Gemmatimonadetes bacterium]|nr:glycosyltransferase family 4 protein [Gemmatimonadota bacterium]
MKVAITGIYPESEERIRGGVEAATLRLSQGLARRGDIDVHVVICNAGRAPGITNPEPNLTLHSIGGSKRFGNMLLSIPDRRRIAAYLRKLKPEVVHAHSLDRFALGAIESRLPTVVTIHGIIEMESALETEVSQKVRGAMRNRLVHAALRKARNVILLSPYVAEHYARDLRRANTWTIENPVADSFFAIDEPEERNTVLHAGLLIPRKGIGNLLQAARIARAEVSDIKIRFAGGATIPDYKEEIDRTVSELGLQENVAFLGNLSPAELALEYGKCELMVMVSKQETLPVAIAECMAAGKPVIASPVGGIPYIVRENETGYLVPHGEPEHLAEKIVSLLSNRRLREKMGAAAKAYARERFTMESVCDRTVAVYREIAK